MALAAVRIVLLQRCSPEWHQEEQYRRERRSLLAGPTDERAGGLLLRTSAASETGYLGVRFRPDFLPGNSDHFEPYQALVSYSGEGTTHLGYYATRAQVRQRQ